MRTGWHRIELSCAAILFDMDGVLVDSGVVVRRTWRRWSALRGFDPIAVLGVAQGRRTIDTLRALAPDLDVEAEARWLEEAELADRDGIHPIPGAVELVGQLPDGRWAVVTSAGHELASRRLDWAGLPIPSCLISAERVTEGKPSPEGYLRAAEQLRIQPAECVVIEDTPPGVRAATAAGMRVVALTTTHDARDLPAVDGLLPDLLGVVVQFRDGELVLKAGG